VRDQARLAKTFDGACRQHRGGFDAIACEGVAVKSESARQTLIAACVHSTPEMPPAWTQDNHIGARRSRDRKSFAPPRARPTTSCPPLQSACNAHASGDGSTRRTRIDINQSLQSIEQRFLVEAAFSDIRAGADFDASPPVGILASDVTRMIVQSAVARVGANARGERQALEVGHFHIGNHCIKLRLHFASRRRHRLRLSRRSPLSRMRFPACAL
jgi:hypothetical protein